MPKRRGELRSGQSLWYYRKNTHDSIIAGPLADPEVVNAMRNALLEFDPQREAGQKFLGSVERLTGFADVGDKVYDRVRDALDAERSRAGGRRLENVHHCAHLWRMGVFPRSCIEPV